MRIICVVPVLALMATLATAGDYEDVKLSAVEVAPKDYRGKSVTYEAEFRNFSSTIPTYMQWNNIRPDQYLLIEAGNAQKLPVVIRRSDQTTALVSGLQKRDTVRVYGTVKEFTVKSTHGMAPSYYVEADRIEKVEKQGKESEGASNSSRRPQRPWKRLAK